MFLQFIPCPRNQLVRDASMPQAMFKEAVKNRQPIPIDVCLPRIVRLQDLRHEQQFPPVISPDPKFRPCEQQLPCQGPAVMDRPGSCWITAQGRCDLIERHRGRRDASKSEVFLDLRDWQVCVSRNRSKKTARPLRRHETTTGAQNLLAVEVRFVAGCCSCPEDLSHALV